MCCRSMSVVNCNLLIPSQDRHAVVKLVPQSAPKEPFIQELADSLGDAEYVWYQHRLIDIGTEKYDGIIMEGPIRYCTFCDTSCR